MTHHFHFLILTPDGKESCIVGSFDFIATIKDTHLEPDKNGSFQREQPLKKFKPPAGRITPSDFFVIISKRIEKGFVPRVKIP